MKNLAVTLILAMTSATALLQAQSTQMAAGASVSEVIPAGIQAPSPLVEPHVTSTKYPQIFSAKTLDASSYGISFPLASDVFLKNSASEFIVIDGFARSRASNFQIGSASGNRPHSFSLVDYEKLDGRRVSRATAYKASSYVPVEDSWIYPAFDRLAALGYLPTSTAILRPWTRLECARLLAEAHASIDEPDDVTTPIVAALDAEFHYETGVIDGSPNVSAEVENAYSRVTGLAGTPLRDGFHFSSSIVNDFGRPFGKGINSYDGISGHAQFGPLAVYARAEYQYASAMPTYSVGTQQLLGAYLSPATTPAPPYGWNLRVGTTNRLRPVELYAAISLGNWQFSFGQQSLWWGPDRSTSLILSNNAEALPMLRIARTKPLILPGFLTKAGPMHFEAFFARQGGIHYVGLGPTFAIYGSPNKSLNPPPYIYGLAFTIKPSDYMELGFAHTVIFAGYGSPLTFGTFFHTFSVDGNGGGQNIDPGKRVTEFNLAYHPPLFRKSLVIYTEAMAWDNPVQGKFIARYAFSPGIYLARIPKLRRLDLRLEGVYTDLPKLPYQGYFYNNARYAQGYTNYGQILGSWVGAQGIGGEGSTTYWFSPRTKANVSYRKMVSDPGYYGGGHRSDLSAKLVWTPISSVEISGNVQYGHWNFPAIAPNSKSDFATTFQVRLFSKAHQDH